MERRQKVEEEYIESAIKSAAAAAIMCSRRMKSRNYSLARLFPSFGFWCVIDGHIYIEAIN
jgi:hypothetical protein